MPEPPGRAPGLGPPGGGAPGRHPGTRRTDPGQGPPGGGAPRRHPGTRRTDPGQHPLDGTEAGRHDSTRRPHPGTRGQSRRQQAQPGGTPRRWGSRPARLGVFIVTGCALLGMLATILTGSEPGVVLDAFLIAGTVTAGLAVRPGAVYLIIPVPALAYVVTATIAGLIRDRATDTSLTGLAVHMVQWIASGFLAMTAATILAIAITVARWPTARRRRAGWRSPPAARAGSMRGAQAAPGPWERSRTERNPGDPTATPSRPGRGTRPSE
jgi:hypothetical protein